MTSLSRNHFADDPNRRFLADGIVNNSYHQKEGIGGISAAGTAGQLIWSLYIPVEHTGYPSPRYTQEDIDAFVEKYGYLKFCPDYSISDVYKTRYGATMIAMEENVLPTKWLVCPFFPSMPLARRGYIYTDSMKLPQAFRWTSSLGR